MNQLRNLLRLKVKKEMEIDFLINTIYILLVDSR